MPKTRLHAGPNALLCNLGAFFTTVPPERRAALILCLAAMVALGAPGYSRQVADAAPTSGTPASATSATSGTPASGSLTSATAGLAGAPAHGLLSDAEILKKVSETENVFDLYGIRDSYTAGDGQSSETLTMINERIEAVQRKLKPIGPLVEGLDLVAFDYRYVSENKYETLWLCLPRTNIGINYHFILYGFPDPSHYGQLSDDARKNGEKTNEFYETWQFEPQPATSACKAGQYILFRHTIADRVRPIPYNMKARLWSTEKGMGGQVILGWWAAVSGKDH